MERYLWFCLLFRSAFFLLWLCTTSLHLKVLTHSLRESTCIALQLRVTL